MDRLLSMRVFERVVSEGSFAAAARQLNLSPPVVTRLVADLEAHLDTRLLQRSTRRLVLTEAGQEYLERVRNILLEIDEAEAQTRHQTRELEGLIRLHAPPVLTTHVVAPLLAEFRRRFPRIRLDIDVNTTADPVVEAYDLVLMGRPANFDGDVIARKVVEASAILVASPHYLARYGTPREPHDLLQHECLQLKQESGERGGWRLWPSHDTAEAVEIKIIPGLSINHTDTLVRAALDGAGITSVTADVVAPYLNRGELVRVLAPWISGRLAMYAVLPSRRFVPRRTRVFLEYLIDATRRQTAQAEQTTHRPVPLQP